MSKSNQCLRLIPPPSAHTVLSTMERVKFGSMLPALLTCSSKTKMTRGVIFGNWVIFGIFLDGAGMDGIFNHVVPFQLATAGVWRYGVGS